MTLVRKVFQLERVVSVLKQILSLPRPSCLYFHRPPVFQHLLCQPQSQASSKHSSAVLTCSLSRMSNMSDRVTSHYISVLGTSLNIHLRPPLRILWICPGNGSYQSQSLPPFCLFCSQATLLDCWEKCLTRVSGPNKSSYWPLPGFFHGWGAKGLRVKWNTPRIPEKEGKPFENDNLLLFLSKFCGFMKKKKK